jgi:uncharacterized protein (TIGR00255 family)
LAVSTDSSSVSDRKVGDQQAPESPDSSAGETSENCSPLSATEKNGIRFRIDELYSTINKIDISEEITRISSHLENMKRVIDSDSKLKGKKIDFILQEITRELGTVSAKSMDYEIAVLVVDLKVELEKIREQIQNVV